MRDAMAKDECSARGGDVPQVDAMAAAVAEALTGVRLGDGGPFGAVVVRDGEIVAQAHNRVVADHDPTAHAEILAIRAAASALGRFDLSDCDLFTTCEPCPMCLAAIHWARLRSVRYGATREDAAAAGFDDGKLYEILAGRQAADVPMTQADAEACREPFRAWMAQADRILY
jgi:guanine deaminase